MFAFFSRIDRDNFLELGEEIKRIDRHHFSQYQSDDGHWRIWYKFEPTVPFLMSEIGGSTLIVFGHPYLTSRGKVSDKLLEEYLERGAGAFENLKGHYIYFCYDSRLKKLISGTDPIGQLPVFYSQNCSTDFIVSHSFWVKEIFSERLEFDIEAISNFLNYGFTLYNETFFRNIKRLESGFRIENSCDGNRVLKSHKSILESAGGAGEKNLALDVLSALEQSLHNITTYWKPKYFHLSGGADSRLMVSCLDKESRGKHTFFTRINTDLEGDVDQDVVLAKEISNLNGLSHFVQVCENNWRNYLDHELPVVAPTVSGAHGGEFLGGQMYTHSPVSLASPISLNSRLKEDLEDRLLGRSFYINQFMRSFRSIIYESTFLGWSSPYIFSYITLSPFWDFDFLSCIMRVPESQLLDYGFYGKVLSTKPEVFDLEFCSSIVEHVSSCRKMTFGKNPKDFAGDTHSPKSSCHEMRSNIRNISSFLGVELENLYEPPLPKDLDLKIENLKNFILSLSGGEPTFQF